MKQKTEVQWGNQSWFSEKKRIAQLQYMCTSEWYTAVKTYEGQQISLDKIRDLWVKIKSYRRLKTGNTIFVKLKNM